jgi:DNA-binding MarR family transcriptional regulator
MNKIDRLKVKELHDQGVRVTDIAKQLGCGKGTVSKILKQMGLEVVKAALTVAPKYVDTKDAASDHLLYLAEKAKQELEWIEKEVLPSTDSEYRAWQDQKIKFTQEMRKLISTIADIGYKLFQASEVTEVLRIIDEEIGYESEECQRRIRERVKRRRDLRFPVEFNR